jgi:IS30 family transposase
MLTTHQSNGNWPMSLSTITMFRVIPEERKRFRHYSYGHFTIETLLSGQNEIVDSLSDRDKRRIALELGIIKNLDSAMPSDIEYQLHTVTAPLKVPATRTFTSDSGNNIHIFPDLQIRAL